jgi:very-short-patch-repair endonuclease
MTPIRWRIDDLASKQHDTIAGWQLLREGFSRGQVDAALRGLRRVHRDVCALGDLTELGWYMAAALTYGPTAAISHLSALMLLELRPFKPGDIHVSVLGAGARSKRDGTILHRRRHMETGTCHGIPVTSPAQSLKDADLPPHELYRALEKAGGHLPSLPLNAVVRLQQAIHGKTRSDTEARFIVLCHERGLPLPHVNQHLNGFETDFHWPRERLVVEVDGFEHHRERPAFNRDRFRGLVHQSRGWHVVRLSADDVYDRPQLVEDALRRITGWRRAR